MKIKKISLKYLFYWTLAVSLVGWSWTTLYIFSYGNIYGGRDQSLQKGIDQKKSDLQVLAEMEEGGAPEINIFDQQIKLSLDCAEGKDFDGARKMLHETDAAVLKLPENNENFGRRVRIATLEAHTYIDQGLYVEATRCLDHAVDLANDMQTKYSSEDDRLFNLGLTNERGVLTYLEANSTLDGKERSSAFDRSQKTFEKLLADINALQADPKKLSEGASKRLAKMKVHVCANLKQVIEDIAYEVQFQKT